MLSVGSASGTDEVTPTRFCTSVPDTSPGWTVPVTVTVTAVPSPGKVTSPNSHTTVRAVTTGQAPRLALAATPSRPTVVVNVTRTPGTTPVPVPDSVTVWLTGRPGAAANGVDVRTGTTSTAAEGATVGTQPARADRAATTGTAHGNIPAP